MPETNGRRTYWLTFALTAAKCVLPVITITLWFIAGGGYMVIGFAIATGCLILAAGTYAFFASWHETTTVYLSGAAWRNAYRDVLARDHLRVALVAGVALLIGGWALTLNHHGLHWDQWLGFVLFVPMAAMTYLVSRVKLYRFEQRDDGLIALFGCSDDYLQTCIEENNRRMAEATGAAKVPAAT